MDRLKWFYVHVQTASRKLFTVRVIKEPSINYIRGLASIKVQFKYCVAHIGYNIALNIARREWTFIKKKKKKTKVIEHFHLRE